MTSPFAYLFDVYSNGHIHGIHNHLESISLHALKLISINLSTLDNPKDIQLAKDLTQEERAKFIALLTKYQEAFA